MEPSGFVPPDLTHPAELLAAGGLALQGGAWAVTAIGAFGLVLAALAFATRNDGGSTVGPAAAGYARLAAALPRVGLAVAMIAGAVAACGTLANRGHHAEQRARAKVLASYPDAKMVQAAPRFGHVEAIPYKVQVRVGKQLVERDAVRHEERWHHLAGSAVRAELRRTADPVREGQDRFGVTFTATYQLVSPLDRDATFFLDVAGPESAAVVHDLALESEGRPLSPEAEGGQRYAFPIAAGGKREVRFRYRAEGVPRWVYDTGGARLSAFELTVATDARNAKFASGVAPTKREAWEGGEALTWSYPLNAAVTEPLGVFTAAGELAPAGLLPRWLLLAPALLGLWLLALASGTRLAMRDMLAVGALFAGGVLATYVGGRFLPPAIAWTLAGLVILFLADGLDDDGTRARLATAFGLVLPGAALALGHAAPALAIAALVLAAWLLRGARAARPAPVGA